ncbi:MAG: type II toxin-antitoxin system RelE/ParE family toxin [Pyrinomonadaceae bacterium]|nr:type II toxin-antitoxin system RelE/ParE family toxin [Pyrinomonadaceae bacterium]
MSEKFRTVVLYKNYFNDFFAGRRQKVKDKIVWTLRLIEELPRVPETYLKSLEDSDDLFEIRIKQGSDIFRVFCFFDEGKLIVLMNGFHKKTQRTPKQEIERGLRIKEEYYAEKK